jgi:hypothetical protein
MKINLLNTLAVAGFGLAVAFAYPGDARSQASIGGDAGVSGSVGAGSGGVGIGGGGDAGVGVGAGAAGGAAAETGIGAGTSGAGVGIGAAAGTDGALGAEAGTQHQDGATFLAQLGGNADAAAEVQVIAQQLVAYDQAMEAGNLDVAASALATAAATAEAEGDLDAQAINQLNAHLGFTVEADVAAELAARID